MLTVWLLANIAAADPLWLRPREMSAFGDQASVANLAKALESSARNLEEAGPRHRAQLLTTRAITMQLELDGLSASERELKSMYAAACRAYEPACSTEGWVDAYAIAEAIGPRCRAGDPVGCLAYGWIDEENAEAWFRTACDLGSSRGCWEVAQLTSRSPLSMNTELLRPACLEGWSAACRNLGRKYEYGAEPDLPLASIYYRIACDLYEPDACVDLGNMYELGKGIPADESFAASLYGSSCSDGSRRGCLALGKLHETGKGADLSVKSALLHYGEACDLGSGEGCLRLGGMQAELLANEPALEAWKKGCDLHEATSCLRIVDATHPLNGPNPDIPMHLYALIGACDAGIGYACVDAGRRLWVGQYMKRDPARAVPLLLRGCEANETKGCYIASRAVAKGQAKERDKVRLLLALQTNCDAGDDKSCALSRKLTGTDNKTR